jgi:hypothetical protein
MVGTFFSGRNIFEKLASGIGKINEGILFFSFGCAHKFFNEAAHSSLAGG